MSIWVVEYKNSGKWHTCNAAFGSRRWAEIFAEDHQKMFLESSQQPYEFRVREYVPKDEK